MAVYQIGRLEYFSIYTFDLTLGFQKPVLNLIQIHMYTVLLFIYLLYQECIFQGLKFYLVHQKGCQLWFRLFLSPRFYGPKLILLHLVYTIRL